MNCKQCNTALHPNARFCPNCGALVTPTSQDGHTGPSLVSRSAHDAPISFPPQSATPAKQNQAPSVPNQPITSSSPWAPTQNVPTYYTYDEQPVSPLQQPPPLQQYRTNNSDRGTQMPPTSGYPATGPKRRRNRAGCIVGCLTVLVLLLLIVGAGWVFLLRPYLHNTAQTQLNHAIASGLQQIPPEVALLPPGALPVGENAINNLIVLNLAPGDPIKNPSTLIAADGVHISFQVYGFGCTVSTKPALQNGRLVATNVALDGPIGLIMSPGELTPLLNQRLSDVQNQLKHPIQSVQLMDHELDLTLGLPLTA